MKERPEKLDVNKDEYPERKSSRKSLAPMTSPIKTAMFLYESGEIHDKSLLIFSEQNSFRQFCFHIAASDYFEWFILTIIVINCIFLAMDTPNPSEEKKYLMEILDIVFNIIYSIEAVIKIIAMGFLCGEYTYLRNAWNQLDFLVVAFGWVGLFLPVNMNAVRCVRLLKPLKTISSVPGMRTQVLALLRSLPSLVNVIFLLTFFVFVFGILGMQLFGGELRQQCIADDFPSYCSDLTRWENKACKSVTSTSTQSSMDLCSSWCAGISDSQCCSFENGICSVSSDPGWSLNNDASSVQACGATLLEDDRPPDSQYGRCGGVVKCSTSAVPSHCGDSGMNLNSEANSFDNFVKAFVTIYQSISLEGWVDVMYAIHEADKSIFAVPYFIFLVLFGAEFILNLLMSVIFIKFEQVKEEQVEAERLAHKEFMMMAIGKKPPEIAQLQSFPIGDPAIEEQNNDDSDHIEKVPLEPCLTRFVKDSRFEQFIILVISINAIMLGMEKYEMSEGWTNFLKVSNIVMTVIFFIEMILKIVGLTPCGYLSDYFNIFDGVIVIFSIVEIILDFTVPTMNIPGVSALRTFRLLRVFKLFRFLTSLQELLHAVMATLSDLKYFSLIMILFIFICALLGMQMYAGEYGDSRANFDNFYWSVITVFQMLSGENWNDVMFTGLQYTNWPSVIFNILVFSAGNYIVLSLFFAILLGNFEDDEEEKEEENEDSMKMKPRSSISPLFGKVHILRKWCCLCIDRYPERNSSSESGGEELEMAKTEEIEVQSNEQTNVIVDFYAHNSEKEKAMSSKIEIVPNILSNHSLGIFASSNPIRGAALWLISLPQFDNMIMFLIAISSLCLALDEPSLNPDGTLKKLLVVSNLVFTIIFAVEMAIKIIALGLIAHEGAYFRGSWNALDGVIVIISIVNLFVGGDSLDSLRALRALRALRPLRMVSRFQSTKVVVNSIIYTIPSLGNVMIITLLFFYIFGIIGVQFFQGKMSRCYGVTDSYERVELSLSRSDCVWSSDFSDYTTLKWDHIELGHFDNIFNSMLILFEVATLEMWPDVMLAVIDGRENQPPKRDNAPELALFFVFFILVCGFFVMSLSIGVIVDEYQKYHDEFTGAGITADQKLLLESIRELLLHKPTSPIHPPKQEWRKKFFNLVISHHFEVIITCCILLNIIVMACASDQMSSDQEFILSIINKIFTSIFLIEMILKHIGLGFKQYWNDNWNRFDGSIVILSLVFLIITFVGTSIPFDPTIARVFRMLRIFRVIKRAKAIQQLIYTLIFSLPALLNVTILMLILFFIYACMGMSMFGTVKHGDFINIHANFETFPQSMLALFRMSTGESWNGIMHDAMIQPPYCDPSGQCIPTETCCGDKTFAIFYFVSFTIISTMVMMNIFVAVILKNFEEQVARERDPPAVTGDHFEQFVKIWTNFSQSNPDEMDCLPIVKLPMVINLVPPPLGRKGNELTSNETAAFIRELHLPGTPQGKVHIMDVGMALTLRVYKAQKGCCFENERIPEDNEMAKLLRQRIYKSFPKLREMKSEQLLEKWECAEKIRSLSLMKALVKKKYESIKMKESNSELAIVPNSSSSI